MTTGPTRPSDLDDIGYQRVEDLLTPAHCEHLCRYLHLQVQNGRLVADRTVAGSLSAYGDPVFDALLDVLTPTVTEIVGEELLPTYSYVRLYLEGTALARHRDRPACEVSTTVTLGGDLADEWPLWVAHPPDDTEVEIRLPVGSAVLYRGCDLEHWREPFAGDWHAQLFLHWVRRGGTSAGEAFDRRPGLGLPAVARP